MSGLSLVAEPTVRSWRPAPATTGEGRVYLDHAASTPCDPAVIELMREVLDETFANPSSPHSSGKRAADFVRQAREQVAEAVGALPEEIVFTSGATESNNLAILGAAASIEARGIDRRKVVTLPLEHPSVLEPCRRLAEHGYETEMAPVRRDGRVDLNALEDCLGENTLLLSIQAANNEIGTIQPLAEAARTAHERGAAVHCDAAQALGKIPLDPVELDLDMMSLSAHKCYGPKGVGALWLRGGPATTPVAPLFFGGGQEKGLRPGTANTPAVVGFGEAARLAAKRLEKDPARIARLRDHLETQVRVRVPAAVVNGAQKTRLPGLTSLTFPGVDADALIARLPEIDLSTASACHTGTPEPSHVLRAIGLTSREAYATLRIALGRTTTREDVEYAARRIGEAVGELRTREEQLR